MCIQAVFLSNFYRCEEIYLKLFPPGIISLFELRMPKVIIFIEQQKKTKANPNGAAGDSGWIN